jgi:hypothetical protein
MQNKIFQISKNQKYQRNLMVRLVRLFSNHVKISKLLSLESTSTDEANNLIKTMADKDNHRMHCDISSPSQFLIQDIAKRKLYGQVFAFNYNLSAKLLYGDEGVCTSSKNPTPNCLMKYEKLIPSNAFVLLEIPSNTPFKLDSFTHGSIITNPAEIYKILPYAEKIKQYYQAKVMMTLDPDVAKDIYNKLVDTITTDLEKEEFFEETTLPYIYPSEYIKSSQTLMAFRENKKKTTDIHYHPGERELIIITTDQGASCELNFCGIKESPADHSESQVTINLQPNSISVLKFTPYTHHKFYGEFVCTSVHPREGPNFIKAVESNNLGNFLESATTFSLKEEKEKIRLDMQAENLSERLEPKLDGMMQSMQTNYKKQYDNHQDNHNNKIVI